MFRRSTAQRRWNAINKTQAAVIRNIEIIGEAANRIHKQAPELVAAIQAFKTARSPFDPLHQVRSRGWLLRKGEMKSVFEQHTTVLAEILSPIEGKHSVGTSNNPDWASPETAQLMIAAFDVMLAKSATEARRAENEYERLCLLGGE